MFRQDTGIDICGTAVQGKDTIQEWVKSMAVNGHILQGAPRSFQPIRFHTREPQKIFILNMSKVHLVRWT